MPLYWLGRKNMCCKTHASHKLDMLGLEAPNIYEDHVKWKDNQLMP